MPVINLLKYLNDDGTFNVKDFLHTVDILITAQDIVINNSSYPTEAIGECARNFRQLGLGYANLGALLMNLALPYDSDEGRGLAAAITSLMTGQAYKTGALLAESLTPFSGYEVNRDAMLHVIEKHYQENEKLCNADSPEVLVEQAKKVWASALIEGEKHGYRNSQATVLAPTGTISFMMDCDTTGIEPDLALVKYKKLADGGLLKIVNPSVGNALAQLGYPAEDIEAIDAYVKENDTIEGAPGLKKEHLPVFDCAFRAAHGERTISYMGHLKMMGAAQPFISGAISKTVNLPTDVTVAEIIATYTKAWELGIKAVALYRDGSKRLQPLSTGKDESAKEKEAVAPIRRRLPDERNAITHKFSIGGLEGYITVGLYEDGAPGEIFLLVAKEGSTLSGIMDAFATSVSLALQYGVPLSALVKKFSHMRFEPSGFTPNKDVPMAKSIVDYVFRWMALKFLSIEDQIALGLKVAEGAAEKAGGNGAPKQLSMLKEAAIAQQNQLTTDEKEIIMSTFQNSEDAPPCTNCGSSMMVRQAGCYVCLNCGAQGGCG